MALGSIPRMDQSRRVQLTPLRALSMLTLTSPIATSRRTRFSRVPTWLLSSRLRTICLSWTFSSRSLTLTLKLRVSSSQEGTPLTKALLNSSSKMGGTKIPGTARGQWFFQSQSRTQQLAISQRVRLQAPPPEQMEFKKDTISREVWLRILSCFTLNCSKMAKIQDHR